jgi:glycosyltransferase involved in cell wall biosynthesis
MTSNLDVSVLMTVYNGQDYIKEAIRSIIDQTFINWRLIVVDNSSTDETSNIINSFSDSRIHKIFLDQQITRTQALNLALRESNSEFIAILDADDLAERDRLKVQVQFMKDNPNAGMVTSSAKLVDANGNVFAYWRPPSFPELLNIYLSWDMPICHSTMLARRKVLVENFFGYNEELKIGQDWDLAIRVAQRYPIFSINEILGSWRRFEGSITGSPENFLTGRLETIKILETGKALAKDLKTLRKNKYRIAVNMLAVSYLSFFNGKFEQSISYFSKAFFLYPLAIFKNNFFSKMVYGRGKKSFVSPD